MKQPRILRLSEEGKHIRFFMDCVSLAEGKDRSVVNITRTGKFHDPRYGEFEITSSMLDEMIRNFDSRTYGQDIALDIAHMPHNGAAGFFRRLFQQDGKLRGEVEWTPLGIEAVTKKGFRYLSAEFSENYMSNESPRMEHGALLMGAGLTTRPVIKNLDPVDPSRLQLSEDALGEGPTYIDDRFKRLLTEEKKTMDKLLEQLRARCKDKKLSQEVSNVLETAFKELAEPAAEDLRGKLLDKFLAQADAIGKQLAEAGSDKTIKLDVSGIEALLKNKPAPAGSEAKTLSEEDLIRILDKRQEEANKRLAEEKTTLEARRSVFDRVLSEAKDLDEEAVTTLSEGVREGITTSMSEDQVKRLAENIVKGAEQIAANKKLSQRGFYGASPSGHVRVEVGQDTQPLKLQEEINKHLKGSSAHQRGALKLAEPGKEKPFVAMVLSEFDRILGPAIDAEVKMLAGGTTGMGDTNLPAGFQRSVIREALHDLRVLELVQTLVDSMASATMNIPFETRDTSNVFNDGVVPEGAEIHRASVKQDMDIAYVLAVKLAFLISNEVAHFSRVNANINWDAYARNVESNARVVRELICRRIANEIQRVSDRYLAASIAAEDFGAQLDGATVSQIKTAQFPIVRPYQARDLKGQAIGAVKNPITIQLNSVAINEFDGTGNQAAGTYYRVTNYNLGYIQFVDEEGTPVFPAATANNETISYDHATNVVKFDTDIPGGSTKEKHWNGFLRAIGQQKAQLAQDRYVQANFVLMSETLHNDATDAEQFGAGDRRDGTDTTAEGDLARVKNIPAFATNAPGINLGEERAIIGVRGTTSYGVAKPFVTGAPFQAVGANGAPTGQMQAYGEEYSVIHTPAPLEGYYTSVLAYSVTNR